MLKIYSTGCINCLEVMRTIRIKKIPFLVIDNQNEVEAIANSTIGIVPVFEFANKYYNHKQIKKMVDEGFMF